MNKKLLIFGLIVIIGTGFYMNGLLSHDNVITTAAGTNVTVPYKHFDLQSNNSAEVFGNEFQDEFTYVIAFNATENPEMYQELCNIVCQGQRYKDDETGVVFFQEVSKELVNTHRLYFSEGLALKDNYFNGGVLLNNETGECIIVVSTIGQDVIDILSSIEWGNKIIKTNNSSTNETLNTTLVDSTEYDTDAATTEPVEETTDETTAHEMYKSQFNPKDGEPKGETLNEEYIESTGASNGKELQEYMESHTPSDYL